MEHIAGLDLKGRAADCLIPETASISAGGPLLVSPGRGQGLLPTVPIPGHAEPGRAHLPANYYLRTRNEWEAMRWQAADTFAATAGDSPPGVRYVTIAGQIPNVWSGLWPDVGRNDVIVETASTYLQPAENDAYDLIPSMFSTNHVSIVASGASWRALVSSLRDYYPDPRNVCAALCARQVTARKLHPARHPAGGGLPACLHRA